MNGVRLAAFLAGMLACACGGSTTSPSQPQAPLATIGFASIPLAFQFAPFAIARESGYVILPYGGNWEIITSYGRPAPSIQFERAPSGELVGAEMHITADGAAFRFRSVDLYSSVTPIPYTFVGTHGTETLFTVTATQPGTFGNFVTVANPRADAVIDALSIRLTIPPCTPVGNLTCANPMGLDNIVVGY
jgi:hypothetical protein